MVYVNWLEGQLLITRELFTCYTNFEEFLGEFQAIISKTKREFSFRMDTI